MILYFIGLTESYEGEGYDRKNLKIPQNQGADSIYMKDIDGIRKRFPNRLLEIEMIRRLKPHSLVKQIKKIQIENEYNIDFDLDSLVNEMEKQQKL